MNNDTKQVVRVRIAPTPSGKLHLGTSHTALFNYLFARHNHGKFIVRIDDSDPKRSSDEFEKNILESLKWLGITWDEGPDIGGPYKPYRQSERMGHYQPYIDKLLKDGNAYLCFCTPEELEAERKKREAEKLPPKYSGKCRNLSAEQIEACKKEGRKPIVRLKVPNKIVSFTDPARGEINVDASTFGDFAIARSDGTALLILTTTIDDIEMKITHAIRGEDYLNIVPRQIPIFEALGVVPPIFAHLPFVYGKDGTKLSKRHGATSVSDYREMGYLPEAIFNYLTLLGWSPPVDKEILTKEETIGMFTLERINTNPHRFDIEKLMWVNGMYIRQKSDKVLIDLLKTFLQPNIKEELVIKILPLVKDRLVKLSDWQELTNFFIQAPVKYDEKDLTQKHEKEDVKKVLERGIELFDKLKSPWQHEEWENEIRKLADEFGWKHADVFQIYRVAVTGKTATPPLFETMEVLGKEEVNKRLNNAIKFIM